MESFKEKFSKEADGSSFVIPSAPLMALKKELARVLGGDEGPFPSHSREVAEKEECEKRS